MAVPVALAALLDLAAVVVFVALGRRSHDAGAGLAAVVEVAAPFLLALVAGWAAVQAWRKPADLRVGLVIWAVTVGLGMILRSFLFGGGTAGSFVIVAAAFLALFLLGWRLVAGAVLRRRPATAERAPGA